nr:MAG TPA: hypothetical protein [Caudoviricetes sp.]
MWGLSLGLLSSNTLSLLLIYLFYYTISFITLSLYVIYLFIC